MCAFNIGHELLFAALRVSDVVIYLVKELNLYGCRSSGCSEITSFKNLSITTTIH